MCLTLYILTHLNYFFSIAERQLIFFFSQLPNGSFQLTTGSQLGIEMEMGKFQFPFSLSIHVANVPFFFLFFFELSNGMAFN